MANILKTYVKMKITMPKILPRFPFISEMFPLQMTSSDVTSLYTNIPMIDTLNIIKDYVNTNDQFTRKTDIPQDKFLHLVRLVLITTWYTFNSKFKSKIKM